MNELLARTLAPKHFLTLILLSLVCCLAAGVLFVFNAQGSRANAEVIGVYKKWTAGTYKSDGGLVCNMWSRPKASVGKYTKRGEVIAFITHFPDEGVMSQISLELGYPIGPKQISVIVNGKKFAFETEGERAYAKESDSKALIEAFRKGSSLLVKSRSKRGTDTKDTFSLSGFTKANNQINKNCAN